MSFLSVARIAVVPYPQTLLSLRKTCHQQVGPFAILTYANPN
jgi:hypothetical protein